MKKIILAVDNEKILKNFNIKELADKKISIKKIQYREGILEILKTDKSINTVILNEKLLGKISIEDLIKKIKKFNKNINIIFILEKNDIEKEKKLKNLKIKNIYKIKNKNKINIKNINKTKKIITFFGEKNLRTTIIFLIIFYLIQKNKKILLINLKKENINKKKLFSKDKFQNILIDTKQRSIIKRINENIEKNIKMYDYILVDSCNIKNSNIIESLLEKSDKIIYCLNNNFLGIRECKEFMTKTKKSIKKPKTGLHIVLNKYYFSSISKVILKNILGRFYNIDKIIYNKNFSNLEEKILKRKKIKNKNKKIFELITK